MKLRGVQQTKWLGVLILAVLILVFPVVITQSFYLTQAAFRLEYS